MVKLGRGNLKWQVYDICIYQNPQNFTMQRANLNACKFLNSWKLEDPRMECGRQWRCESASREGMREKPGVVWDECGL